MIDTVTAYVIAWLPTLIAFASNLALVFSCFSNWKKVGAEIKNSTELNEVLAQNKMLVEELRRANKLNRELLTKIDKIQRGE